MPTPEEIAEALWRSRTHLPHVKICNERDLEEIARVAAAIRDAVAEEREACANLCKIDIITHRAKMTAIEMAVLETAQEIEKSIRARSEKVSPDLVKGD